jgi:hypothetical protein
MKNDIGKSVQSGRKKQANQTKSGLLNEDASTST